MKFNDSKLVTDTFVFELCASETNPSGFDFLVGKLFDTFKVQDFPHTKKTKIKLEKSKQWYMGRGFLIIIVLQKAY